MTFCRFCALAVAVTVYVLLRYCPVQGPCVMFCFLCDRERHHGTGRRDLGTRRRLWSVDANECNMVPGRTPRPSQCHPARPAQDRPRTRARAGPLTPHCTSPAPAPRLVFVLCHRRWTAPGRASARLRSRAASTAPCRQASRRRSKSTRTTSPKSSSSASRASPSSWSVGASPSILALNPPHS